MVRRRVLISWKRYVYSRNMLSSSRSVHVLWARGRWKFRQWPCLLSTHVFVGAFPDINSHMSEINPSWSRSGHLTNSFNNDLFSLLWKCSHLLVFQFKSAQELNPITPSWRSVYHRQQNSRAFSPTITTIQTPHLISPVRSLSMPVAAWNVSKNSLCNQAKEEKSVGA